MWNRILENEELTSLAECNPPIAKGNVFSWSDAKPLWLLSNVTIEEFEEGKVKELCGKLGELLMIFNKHINLKN